MNGQQLKNSILQMAVQGKLVPQDPNDEPASVLLEKIRKEKEKLIKEGKIKKEKNPSYIFRGADNLPYEKVGNNEPICIADEVPFEIPNSWEWTKIESISIPVGNKTNQILAKEILNQGKLPVVSQGKELIDGYCNNEDKKINVLPLVMFGDHTRNVKYIDFEFVIGADGTKFHKIVICNAKYIYYWMSYAAETLRNRGYARHYSLLKKCYIPLPPLNEQSRIVEMIERISPAVDKYELIDGLLSNLNNTFPNQLKNSILQEAIQGKLVQQDPNDEPASVSLERIRAEKQRLIKEEKIKKDKHESIIFRRDNSYYEKVGNNEPVCIADEVPFEIPDSWEWTKIESISIPVGNKSNQVLTKEILNQGKIPVVSQGKELIDGYCNNEDKKIDVLPLVMFGDHTRNVKYIDFEFVIGADGTKFHKIITCSTKYVYYWMVYASETLRNRGYARHYSLLKKCYIPLPPLNEQHRIVKKVEDVLSHIGNNKSAQ